MGILPTTAAEGRQQQQQWPPPLSVLVMCFSLLSVTVSQISWTLLICMHALLVCACINYMLHMYRVNSSIQGIMSPQHSLQYYSLKSLPVISWDVPYKWKSASCDQVYIGRRDAM